MEPYYRNRYCGCMRCRTHGYMGAAVLVTLGVLFLAEEFTRISFHQSWPLILIVIGVVLFLQRTASAAGHANPVSAEPQATMPAAPPEPPQSTDQQVPHG